MPNKIENQGAERFQRRFHAGRDALDSIQQILVGDNIKKGEPHFRSRCIQSSKAGIAEPALRYVDDAHQADGIHRIVDDAQISDDVFDFLSVIELQAADHRVGNPCTHEPFLQHTGLRIRAI